MGLLVLSYMSSGPMPKTLTMAVLGLLLGMIGIDPMSGYNRFSGGVHELSDGLGVLPLAVGLFGVSEIMLAYGTRAMQPMKPRFSELMPSRAEARASVGPIGRGTVIGFLIGIIPGSAHILSSFVSYAVEKKLSDHPERFGKGAVEGVAGPESANNAAACGAFVPMLALGVPLGPVQAILIAVLVVHGIAPGPLLITQQPQLFWGFIASMYIGNLVLLDPQPAAGRLVRLAAANSLHLSLSGHPGVLHRRRLHGQSQHGRGADHGGRRAPPATRCGKLQYDVAPIVLGFILSPMLEMAFRQSLAMSGGDYTIFLQRPITVALLRRRRCCCWPSALLPAVLRRRHA